MMRMRRRMVTMAGRAQLDEHFGRDGSKASRVMWDWAGNSTCHHNSTSTRHQNSTSHYNSTSTRHQNSTSRQFATLEFTIRTCFQKDSCKQGLSRQRSGTSIRMLWVRAWHRRLFGMLMVIFDIFKCFETLQNILISCGRNGYHWMSLPCA